MASLATRNPHVAFASPSKEKKPAAEKVLQKIGLGKHFTEKERVTSQWTKASGCPISDDAKNRFTFSTNPGSEGHKFVLADVRLWKEAERQQPGAKGGESDGSISLEFFFDGELGDIPDEASFTRSFDEIIELQLQERRMLTFREKFARRQTQMRSRKKGQALGGTTASAGGGGSELLEDPETARTSKETLADSDEEQEWQNYLKSKVPETRLAVRAFRESGCMLRFVCVQTSLSVGASDVLGQVCFPEYFPVDGRPQTLVEDLKAFDFFLTWHWALFMVFFVLFGVAALYAWYKTISEAFYIGMPRGGIVSGSVS